MADQLHFLHSSSLLTGIKGQSWTVVGGLWDMLTAPVRDKERRFWSCLLPTRRFPACQGHLDSEHTKQMAPKTHMLTRKEGCTWAPKPGLWLLWVPFSQVLNLLLLLHPLPLQNGHNRDLFFLSRVGGRIESDEQCKGQPGAQDAANKESSYYFQKRYNNALTGFL